MEPVGSKKNTWELDPTLKCPAEVSHHQICDDHMSVHCTRVSIMFFSIFYRSNIHYFISQGAPYFYTRQNSQSFGSFGALPNNDSEQDTNEASPVNLLAVLLGVGVAVLVTVLVVVGGVMGAVWYKRRQHWRRNLSPGTVVCDTEKVYLIRKN